MAFIIRKDWPLGKNWPPLFVEKVFGLETYGCVTVDFPTNGERSEKSVNSS